jgi:hypothetical protein
MGQPRKAMFSPAVNPGKWYWLTQEEQAVELGLQGYKFEIHGLPLNSKFCSSSEYSLGKDIMEAEALSLVKVSQPLGY